MLSTMQRWRQRFMSWQGDGASFGGADACSCDPVRDSSMIAFSEFVRLFLRGQLRD